MKEKENIKTGNIPLHFDFEGMHYDGLAIPLKESCNKDACFELDITLNGNHTGTITCSRHMKWTMESVASQELVNRLGEIILSWYE